MQQWWGQQQLLYNNCCEFLFKQTWGQRSDFVLLFFQRVYFCPMCLPKNYNDILENCKLFIGDIIHYDFPHASIPRNLRILIVIFRFYHVSYSTDINCIRFCMKSFAINWKKNMKMIKMTICYNIFRSYWTIFFL